MLGLPIKKLVPRPEHVGNHSVSDYDEKRLLVREYAALTVFGVVDACATGACQCLAALNVVIWLSTDIRLYGLAWAAGNHGAESGNDLTKR